MPSTFLLLGDYGDFQLMERLAKAAQPRCSRVEWKRPCSAKGRKSLQPSQGSQSSCTAFLAYCCGALLFLHAASAPPRTSSVCITGDLTLMNALESCVPQALATPWAMMCFVPQDAVVLAWPTSGRLRQPMLPCLSLWLSSLTILFLTCSM